MGWLAALPLLDWSSVPEDITAFFLFLGVFPIVNALFDVVSYAVTLALMRRGLTARLPLLYGVLDLGIACLLFLGLGLALTALIVGMNALAGVPLVDLGALFAAVADTPGDHLWLFLMLFSTILPTLLHGLLSLLGVQGIWPRFLRRPVANWVDGAAISHIDATRAPFALGTIWALSLFALCGIVALIWWYAKGIAFWFLEQYYDLLLHVAHEPLGAF